MKALEAAQGDLLRVGRQDRALGDEPIRRNAMHVRQDFHVAQGRLPMIFAHDRAVGDRLLD